MTTRWRSIAIDAVDDRELPAVLDHFRVLLDVHLQEHRDVGDAGAGAEPGRADQPAR
jgi:hypothetical protein